uniref:Uncharacterized protein n=1 Tax=Plectus sambesii TaxID=2011161 RepID=A0A914VM82_9BILA
MFRPLLNENFSEDRLCDFVVSVLTAPALLIHLSQESITLLLTNNLFERTINVLLMDRYSRRIFDRLDGVTSLNLLANLIHMSTFD